MYIVLFNHIYLSSRVYHFLMVSMNYGNQKDGIKEISTKTSGMSVSNGYCCYWKQ